MSEVPEPDDLIASFPTHRDDLLQVEPCPGGSDCALDDPKLRNARVMYGLVGAANSALSWIGVMKAHGDRMEADRIEVALREWFDVVEAYARQVVATYYPEDAEEDDDAPDA